MTQLKAQPSEPRPGKPWPGGPLPGGPIQGEPIPGGLTLAAARFFAARLAASWVPAYLAGRGFGERALRPWTVGYAPAGWRVLTDPPARSRLRGHLHPGRRAGPAD